jgi:2-polyprenyl-3-methyl-5-hydroxy-6-metoxy-1,4-benzoquinol methylase
MEFRLSDVREVSGAPEFDIVYARFLLTHLSDPADAVNAFHRHLRPGGLLAVEDIDFSGYFTYPESGLSGGTMNSTARSCAGGAVTRTLGHDCLCF